MNSNKSLVELPTDEERAKVRRLFESPIDSLLEAAREWVTTVEQNPAWRKWAIDELGVPKKSVEFYDKIGDPRYSRELALSSSIGASRARHLPMSEQIRVAKEGIEVLDDDETTVRIIPLDDMSSWQADLAIGLKRGIAGSGWIRTMTEQRTMIREKKAKRISLPPEAVRVMRDGVVVPHYGKIPRALILQWVAEMG